MSGAFACLFMHVCLSVFLFVVLVHCARVFVFVTVLLGLCALVFRFVSPSLAVRSCLSVVCLSLYLFVCLYVCLSVCLSVSLAGALSLVCLLLGLGPCHGPIFLAVFVLL